MIEHKISYKIIDIINIFFQIPLQPEMPFMRPRFQIINPPPQIFRYGARD